MPGSDAPATGDVSRVFAHSGDTLYRLNPLSLSATQVGTMTGIGTQSLLDLAIDKNDSLIGITRDKIYSLDETSGSASLLGDLATTAQGFTSLSYTPMNPSDPNSPDILVSANDMGEVFQITINGGTASASQIGSYGMSGANRIVSSGDLIGVHGYGIYATVDVEGSTMDYLARIDPANGWRATVMPQPTGFDKIFGLGFWHGKVYGFVDNGFEAMTGTLIQIDPVTGAATELNTGSERWFGAGVATDAPIIQ